MIKKSHIINELHNVYDLQASEERYNAKLIANNEHGKVIDYIRKELGSSATFGFSVAFVTYSGLNLLLLSLRELDEKGVHGRLLTSSYLCFNEPSIFYKLLEIKNLEVRVTDKDFHSKGYIFENDTKYTVMIGSSNLTKSALMQNIEWNLAIEMKEKREVYMNVVDEFENEWALATPLEEPWILKYLEKYEKKHKKAEHTEDEKDISELEYKKIIPNDMQKEAMMNLEKLRMGGSDRGLIISATGTGKTYLAAFDVKQYKPKKLLFLAHRERLLKDARLSFLKVIGNRVSTGFYMSNVHDIDKDFIFASVATLCKDDHLVKFSPTEFDYIIVDEVHHAGANTYQKILDYFKPKFLLGMTATPERSDDYDIFKFFNYKIAYEIRLQEALASDMLCPFHYFGISDLSIDGVSITDTTDFNHLICKERVQHIITTAEYYGYSGCRLKGLIFCSRIDEAYGLAKELSAYGYRTFALSGGDSDAKRENAIQRLEQDSEEEALDYIITVDIFNEGIDIPAVNQIIMLRDTESSIVFIQQLGRGLRKYKDKEYVTVLDFIGNYDKNFLIPIALSGDISYNKDNLRRFIFDPGSIISGDSSIEFDYIVRNKIYEAINNAKFQEAKFIRQQYELLKKKIGHIPSHQDFMHYEAIDLQNIIKKYESYTAFLLKYETDFNALYSKYANNILKFVSLEISNGKRIHEIFIMRLLLDTGKLSTLEIADMLARKYELHHQKDAIQSALRLLSGGFLLENEKKKYNSLSIVCEQDGVISFTDEMLKELENKEFRLMLEDVLEYSRLRYEKIYSHHYGMTNLTLYEKYTRKDVCKLLNWRANEVPNNIGGYRYNKEANNMCVYVTYQKGEDINDSIKYEDRFINEEIIICISKARRTKESNDMKVIRSSKEKGVLIHLFMNRLKEEQEFYYLGEITYDDDMKEIERQIEDRTDSVVEITYKLDTPVRSDVYNYLTNK